jgi:hypothetical protein
MAEAIRAMEVAEAVQTFYDELPGMLGSTEWQRTQSVIDGYLVEMKTGEGQIAAMKLLQVLARFPAARERMEGELLFRRLKAAGAINPENRSGIEYFRLGDEGQGLRHVTIRPGGTGGATSRKFGNLRLDASRLLDAVGNTASGVIGAAVSSSHLVIITSVLGVIRGINKALTVDISETNARVFWALVRSRAEQAAIGEATLLATANEERSAAGLPALSAEQLRESLYALEAIQSVARVPEMPDHWYIVESFHVSK